MNDSNIIDATKRFGNAPSINSEEKNLESIRKSDSRLAGADDIEANICNKNIPLGDRPIFARNLGRMIEEVTQKPLPEVKRLFDLTFVEEFESALKKRKRYIRLSGEGAESNETFNAAGAKYVDLAKNWVRMHPKSVINSVDAIRQAILRLIEGSSFDTRSSGNLRHHETGRVDFVNRMTQLVRSIEKQVPLHAYFDRVNDYPLWADNPVQSSLFGTTHWLNLENLQIAKFHRLSKPIGEEGDDAESSYVLSPKVPLGVLYKRVTIENCISYKLTNNDENKAFESTNSEDLRLREALVGKYGSLGNNILDNNPDNPSEEDEEDQTLFHMWDSLADTKKTIWIGKDVVLHIFRERSTGLLRPVLVISSGMSIASRELSIGRPSSSSIHNSVRWLSYLVDMEENSYHGTGILVRIDQVLDELGQMPHADTLNFINNDTAMELLFQPTAVRGSSDQEMVFVPFFPDEEDFYTPAPADTMAGAILRNLANAPLGQRIDELLLADAKTKVAALDDLLQKENLNYNGKLKRLEGNAEDVS